MGTVARANAQANAPQVAPAHLRETVTPVPPEVLADGGMSLAEQPGMAAGFGDLTEHDFLRVNTDVPGLKVLHRPPVVTVEGFLTRGRVRRAHKRREGFGRDANQRNRRRGRGRRTCERRGRARSTPSY